MIFHHDRNRTELYEDMLFNGPASLSLSDIMPKHSRLYDKNRAPKLLGQPTVVYFHVTILSLDSINEESMASGDSFLCMRQFFTYHLIRSNLFVVLFVHWIPCVRADICNWYFLGAKLARSSATIARKHERRVPHFGRRLVAQHMASGLFFQKCKKSHIPRDEHTEPLFMVVQR